MNRKSCMETNKMCKSAEENEKFVLSLARHLLSHSLFDLEFRSLFVFRIADVILWALSFCLGKAQDTVFAFYNSKAVGCF